MVAALAAPVTGWAQPKPAKPAKTELVLGGPFSMKQATAGLKGKGQLMVRIETSLGVVEAELFEFRTPTTVANFVGLARGLKPFRDIKTGKTVTRPYYDGIVFHRVIPNFMVQTGCPEGSGRGGPGYTFEDEFYPTLKHDAPGTLSMANSGPGTNGSQFFITDVPTPHLDRRHSVFGRVSKGLGVVRKIARVSRDPRTNAPRTPVIMKKVTIYRAESKETKKTP